MSRTASGLRAWLLQRVTAVYIGLFSLYLVGRLLLAPPADWNAWRDLYRQDLMGLATLLFAVAVLLHAWVGIRDVLIDYVKPFGLRLLMLVLVASGLLACGLWVLEILMRVRIG